MNQGAGVDYLIFSWTQYDHDDQKESELEPRNYRMSIVERVGRDEIVHNFYRYGKIHQRKPKRQKSVEDLLDAIGNLRSMNIDEVINIAPSQLLRDFNTWTEFNEFCKRDPKYEDMNYCDIAPPRSDYDILELVINFEGIGKIALVAVKPYDEETSVVENAKHYVFLRNAKDLDKLERLRKS